MPTTNRNNKKLFFTALLTLFLLLSIGIGIYLVKQRQLISQQAYLDGKPWCDSSYGQNDQCTPSTTQCQKDNRSVNTGFLCTCIDLSPNISCNRTVWNCSQFNPTVCPSPEGPPPIYFEGNCQPYNAKIEGRCLVSLNGNPISAPVYQYWCPGRFDTEGGCQENEVVQNRQLDQTSICFDSPYCGAQQIDISYPGCWMSVVDYNCETPAPPEPTPTTVPTPTIAVPTPTPIPVSSPTPTLPPGITPTVTPIPPTPTSTPIPTPTRTPTPTPRPPDPPPGTPNICNGTCGSDSNCGFAEDGTRLTCVGGFCRHPSCKDQISCHCPPARVITSPTPTPSIQLPQSGEIAPTLTLTLGSLLLIGLGLILAL